MKLQLIALTTLTAITFFSCNKEIDNGQVVDKEETPDFPEIVSIDFSSPVQPGDNVYFSATLKSSDQSSNFTYEWEVEGEVESNSKTLNHIFITEGAYEVKLTVTNDHEAGTAISEETVTVYVAEIHEGQAFFSSKGNNSQYFVSIHVTGPNNYEEDLYIVDYDYSSQYNCDVPSYMYTNNNLAGRLSGLRDGTYAYTWESDAPLQLPITGTFTILNESCSHLKH